MAADSPGIDLTGRGLEFLLSFDVSRAQASLGNLQPTMEHFLRMLGNLKATAADTAQSISNMFQGVSRGFEDASLLSLLTAGPARVQSAGNALNNVMQGLKEHLRQLREQTRLWDDDMRKIEATTGRVGTTMGKVPPPGSGAGGVPGGGEEDGGTLAVLGIGRNRGLVQGLAGLGTLAGVVGQARSYLTTITELSGSLDRLGIMQGRSAEQMKVWHEGVVGIQRDVGTTVAEVTDAARVFMEFNRSLEGFEGTKPFIETATAMSRITGESTKATAAILSLAERIGLVTGKGKDVQDFAFSLLQTMRVGAGSTEDLVGDIAQAQQSAKFFYDFLRGQGVDAAVARKEMQGVTTDMVAMMRQFRAIGQDPADIPRLAGRLQQIGDKQFMGLMQVLRSQAGMAQDQIDRVSEALTKGDPTEIVRAFANAVKDLRPGVERIIGEKLQEMGGSLSNDVVGLIARLRVIPEDMLKSFAEIRSKIGDGTEGMKRLMEEFNKTPAGALVRMQEMAEQLRGQHALFLTQTGLVQGYYDALRKVLEVMYEWPNATRLVMGVLGSAGLAGSLMGLFRLFGWTMTGATSFTGMAKALGLVEGSATAAAAAFKLLGVAGTALTFVGAIAAIGYVAARLTGLDKQIMEYDWSAAGGDAFRLLKATVQVVGEDLSRAWESVKSVVMSVKSAIDVVIDAVGMLISKLASAASYIPGFSALKNYLSGGAAQQGAAAAPGSPQKTQEEPSVWNLFSRIWQRFDELGAAQRTHQEQLRSDMAIESARRARENFRGSSASGIELSSFAGPRVADDSVRQYALQSGSIIAQEIRRQMASMSLDGREAGPRNSIQAVAADMSAGQLLLRMDSVSRDVGSIVRLVSTGLDQRNGSSHGNPVSVMPPQAVVQSTAAPAPAPVVQVPVRPDVRPVDTNSLTRQELMGYLESQHRAGVQQVTALKTDNSELIQVIREVASQVAQQVAYHAQARQQIAPPKRFDVGPPWSPAVTATVPA